MTREEKEKIIAECEHMSFDFELLGRPTKALCLDTVKNILNNILESEYISNDISETESEIEPTTKDDKDCEHCAKTYGTLGCCDTVGNEWVYSCKEGHEEYAKGLRKFEPTTKNDIVDDAISRKDVLKLIYDYKEKHSENREEHPINYGTLLDMIRWVLALPSVTPQTDCDACIPLDVQQAYKQGYESARNDLAVDVPDTNFGDLISRQAIINRLDDFNNWCKDGRLQGSLFAVDVIKDMPSVTTQEPRKGHWDIKDKMWWVCSACGCQTRMMKKYNVPNFCPACGAQMDESEVVENGNDD